METKKNCTVITEIDIKRCCNTVRAAFVYLIIITRI